MNKEEIQKGIAAIASRARWVGWIVGALIGFALGFAVGCGQG